MSKATKIKNICEYYLSDYIKRDKERKSWDSDEWDNLKVNKNFVLAPLLYISGKGLSIWCDLYFLDNNSHFCKLSNYSYTFRGNETKDLKEAQKVLDDIDKLSTKTKRLNTLPVVNNSDLERKLKIIK